MTMAIEGFDVQFEPSLVEEAVLRAIDARPPHERMLFRRERNVFYSIADQERREEQFADLHGRWFSILGLGKKVIEVLEEYPILCRETRRCLVLPVRGQKEESADLLRYEGSGQSDTPKLADIVIWIRPTSLLNEDSFLSLLRRELEHVADMVDPDFGYDPELPRMDSGPSLDNLLRARYRTLWDTNIDGRLLAKGLLPAEVEEVRRREFATAFPMLEGDVETAFERFFRSRRPRHEEFMEFARNPQGSCSRGQNWKKGIRPCPLCRFPSTSFETSAARLPSEVLRSIQSDFPRWYPESGLCQHCADLYSSLSMNK